MSDEQLFVGARVKILVCDIGWRGCTGVVKEKFSHGGWWLKLDNINSAVRQLYKAEQLTWNLANPTGSPALSR